jgi:hypothetical protein
MSFDDDMMDIDMSMTSNNDVITEQRSERERLINDGAFVTEEKIVNQEEEEANSKV